MIDAVMKADEQLSHEHIGGIHTLISNSQQLGWGINNKHNFAEIMS